MENKPSPFHPFDEIQDFFKRLFARSLPLDFEGAPKRSDAHDAGTCQTCGTAPDDGPPQGFCTAPGGPGAKDTR